MKLFLMRHGEAETFATSDKERKLTAHGVKECETAAKWLKLNAVDIDFALVSPYVRAQQTFQTVSQTLNVKASQTVVDITPDGDPSWVADYLDVLISENTELNTMLVVTHMPLVSSLLDILVANPVGVFFPTGGLAMVELEGHASKGQLLGFG